MLKSLLVLPLGKVLAEIPPEDGVKQSSYCCGSV